MRNYQVPFKWFYEPTKEEAKKYNTIVDFAKGSRGAYKSALKNGWLDEFFDRQLHKPYTYDECFNIAKRYSSKIVFKNNEPSAYSCARINDWLKDYTWFSSPIIKQHEEDDYLIYVYIDEETKSVYVGLTYQLRKRDKRHRNGQIKKGVRKFDNLNKYFKSIGKEIPEPIVKMTNLSAEQAQWAEDWYKMAYKDAGWNVINKAKTGIGVSALGGTYRKWDYQRTKEEASKYASRTQFCNGNGSAYVAALRNKWIEEFFPS